MKLNSFGQSFEGSLVALTKQNKTVANVRLRCTTKLFPTYCVASLLRNKKVKLIEM